MLLVNTSFLSCTGLRFRESARRSPSPPSRQSVATKNASVMGSEPMSTSPTALSVPIGGPVTVVSVAVCTTVGSRTSLANRVSPWREKSPIETSMQDVLVKSATPSGYVALDASGSIVVNRHVWKRPRRRRSGFCFFWCGNCGFGWLASSVCQGVGCNKRVGII